ncbi:lipoyl protein ligase domain-containing protein [Rhabdochlamydiaceae symbiont of Dictyostelium giganteum]|uniref:lipoyl protein ligase domain-containing protein n=1 Tax=Rhabdochlamydiaceae symbiont of Dictyostelium giganteum TaxID=3342349 RepID=UPI0038508ECE
MSWTFIARKAAKASENMEYDAELLKTLVPEAKPILHLYDWERPSLTYGFFARPEKLLHLDAVKKHGFDLARRPTGGGVVFHAWDLAFSVLIPAGSSLYSQNTLENYELINQVVFSVVQDFVGSAALMSLTPSDTVIQHPEEAFFCMARPTKYDLVVGEKKIAGAAQRKMKQGFLHQGTIALQFPDLNLLDELLPSFSVREAMRRTTFPLLSENISLEEGRDQLRLLLQKRFLTL